MRNINQTSRTKRIRRKARIRSKVKGTEIRPRLSIFKSNKYMSAQIINDDLGATLVSGTTKTISGKSELEKARALGKVIAEKALKQNISKVVFDRGGYIYTGKVSAIAEGARDGGLEF